MIKTIKRIYRTAFTQLRLVTAIIGVLTVSAVVWSLMAGTDSGLAADEISWGSETQNAVSEPWSPIQSANACGLGASSCFKCHNGRRAKKWSEDPKTAPWHPNHKKVNFSCAGCHKGNPRLLKESLAHKKLIADPRKTPDRCMTCHTSGKTSTELLKPYAIGGAG